MRIRLPSKKMRGGGWAFDPRLIDGPRDDWSSAACRVFASLGAATCRMQADCAVSGSCDFSLLQLCSQARVQIVLSVCLLQSREGRLTCAVSGRNPLHLPLRL